MIKLYRKPRSHIEAPALTPLTDCPFCSCKSFSRATGCPKCGIFVPSARSEKPVPPSARRKYRKSNPVPTEQEEAYDDDHPDDDLGDGLLMPPTTDELEALPWDNLNQYLPTISTLSIQEEY